MDHRGVPLQTEKLPATLDVPDARRGVTAARDAALAIGGDGKVDHVVLVSLELADLLAAVDVPQTHQRLTGTEEVLAVGREDDTIDIVGVPLEAFLLLALG